MICSEFGPAEMLIAIDWICAGRSWSRTVTPKFAVLIAVGVPEITPVEDPSVSPAGSDPEVTDHV